jgi:hypothetical protein
MIERTWLLLSMLLRGSWRNDQFAKLFSLLHALVRLTNPGKGIGAVNNWLKATCGYEL